MIQNIFPGTEMERYDLIMYELPYGLKLSRKFAIMTERTLDVVGPAN